MRKWYHAPTYSFSAGEADCCQNFHGYLNGIEYAAQGSNYGYPYCYAAWDPSQLPQNSNLTVGSNFAMGDQNSTINDTFCAALTPPRLTFQAHMAPLDIKFNNSASEAWITFHGSWSVSANWFPEASLTLPRDRSDPVGYKLSVLSFQDGEPVAAPANNTALSDVFWNVDNSVCPQNCFRPVGIAFDGQGRLFVSSDATGEIYVVAKDSSEGTVTGTTTSPSPSPTSGASIKQLDYGIVVLSLAFVHVFILHELA